MAIHTGIILNTPFTAELLNNSLPDVNVADYTQVVLLSDRVLYGDFVDTASTLPFIDTFDGVKLRDFADLWYNHFHIIPNRINVGNLTSQQVRPIELFNGYFEDRTISAVVNMGLNGVSFDVTTPETLAPLESIYRDLTIDTVGTPSFDGSFEITVDDIKTIYYLYVTGKRVLVMPFQHNWSYQLKERLAWYNTSSGKSLDGIEQLQSWRDKPRRSLTYDFLLASSTTNAARLRAMFAALMAGWQVRLFAVPIWSDATRLKVLAAAAQNEVMVSTTYFDYDSGSYVMLWQDEENYELAEIDEVLSDRVTLKVNLTREWAANRTVVMPARLAYINQNLQGTKHTVDIDTVPVTFEFLPQHPSLNRIVYAAEVMYRSAPVLLTKNNYANNSSFVIEQPVIRNDSDTGIFSLEADQPAPDVSNNFSFLFANHAQIAAYYGWLDNRKGRLNIFWQPTWSKDMQPVQDISSASTTLLIKAIGYTSLYYIDEAPAYNRRDIMIALRNGTKYYRRITGVDVNNDNTETVSINAALGADVLLTDIDRISFLIPSALKADAVDIDWHSGNVSESNIQIADVYDDTI